jgi:hypothetical protein
MTDDTDAPFFISGKGRGCGEDGGQGGEKSAAVHGEERTTQHEQNTRQCHDEIISRSV